MAILINAYTYFTSWIWMQGKLGMKETITKRINSPVIETL